MNRLSEAAVCLVAPLTGLVLATSLPQLAATQGVNSHVRLMPILIGFEHHGLSPLKRQNVTASWPTTLGPGFAIENINCTEVMSSNQFG